LESLRTANQSFRGFASYQWLEADFISLFSAHGAHRPSRNKAAVGTEFLTANPSVLHIFRKLEIFCRNSRRMAENVMTTLDLV
jgi:hypothetical protein